LSIARRTSSAAECTDEIGDVAEVKNDAGQDSCDERDDGCDTECNL
jgi:hypothetical protein